MPWTSTLLQQGNVVSKDTATNGADRGIVMQFNAKTAAQLPASNDGEPGLLKENQTVQKNPNVLANTAWYECERANKTAEELKQDLKQFVRNHVFPKCKMVTNPMQLQFTTDKKSICQFVCEGMNVKPSRQGIWWEQSKKAIHQCINKRRGHVSTAVKNVFIGEFFDGNETVAVFEGLTCVLQLI